MAAAKVAKDAARDARRAVIDRIGELEGKLAEHFEDAKELEKLRKDVRTWPAADHIAPDSTVLYRGSKYAVALGMQENQRRIKSIRAVYQALKLEAFLAVADVTLKALEEIAPEKISDLVTEGRTGPRSITVTPL